MELREKVLSPKKQVIRERPGRILSVARALLDEEGYAGVTMERIAKVMNCSRPPIYKHFSSREDVVMGLAIEDAQQRWKLFKCAATFQGRPREKLVAVNEFVFRTYPDQLRILSLLQPNLIRLKATSKHQETLADYESRAFDILTRIVDEGVEQGDLVIPGGQPASTVAYGLLCLSFGGSTFESRYPDIPIQQRNFNRHLAARLTLLALLDGYRFKPLSLDWDYIATIERVRKELNILAYIEETNKEKPSVQYDLHG
jgi:AcrR family transcriptional regulator